MSDFEAKEVWGWSLYEDGDDGWQGSGTREEAIIEARERLEDEEEGSAKTQPVYVHKGRLVDPAMLVPDADHVMEMMTEHMHDNYGCPDFVDDPVVFKEGAEAVLEKLLETWARQYVDTKIWEGVGKAERVDPQVVVEFEAEAT